MEQFVTPEGRRDRGVLAIYLLNLVRLNPGEATFLEPGRLHAYLEGVAVEIMANSDNVIRGGLTSKHVDVAELLRLVVFDTAAPVPLEGRARGPVEWRYMPPVSEFALSRLAFPETPAATAFDASGPEALIVVTGPVQVGWAGGEMALSRGGALLVPAGLRYRIAANQSALVFRAFVPS
jgi:mannose-6-phosphate isomerase